MDKPSQVTFMYVMHGERHPFRPNCLESCMAQLAQTHLSSRSCSMLSLGQSTNWERIFIKTLKLYDNMPFSFSNSFQPSSCRASHAACMSLSSRSSSPWAFIRKTRQCQFADSFNTARHTTVGASGETKLGPLKQTIWYWLQNQKQLLQRTLGLCLGVETIESRPQWFPTLRSLSKRVLAD